jgi:2-dehydro-3-deoxy-D-arabinonate dehydratase
VWCAGVTYYRSRAARMEESADGGDVYDRVYEAERPELFFKATAPRVVAHRQPIRVRRDSTWSVPEAELVLVIDADANIIGYTVGNDVSARDIEGANPLYLPQAKVYDQACAVGPGIYLPEEALADDTTIRLRISRGDTVVFEGESSVAQIKRPFESLVEYLYRDNSFPAGCLLMTGTGIIPPDDFSLEDGDMVRIDIDQVGRLENPVVKASGE